MKIGAILRAFEKNRDKLEDTAMTARYNALMLKKVLYGNVLVMVARDKDCGMLANTLRFHPGEGFPVIEARGDNSKEVLNVGVNMLPVKFEADIALVIAGYAVGRMTQEIAIAAKKEFEANKNLAVVGVTLDDNLNRLIEQGFIQNTCAFWRISSLLSVGGFTSDRGVEEVSVMAELFRKGFSSAILRTKSSKNFSEEVIRSKWERIDQELARANSSREKIGMMLSSVPIDV